MFLQLVVFDMAGTTVSEGGAVYSCLEETLAAEGIVTDQERLHQIKGTDKREALRLLMESSPRGIDLLPRYDELYQRFSQRLTDFYRHDPSIKEFLGTSDVLRALRALGIRTALNTGFTRDVADILIDRLGWRDGRLIDASITSDEVPRGRPYPDMIHALMQRFRIEDPRRVAKVGDAPADLLEGRQAGCGLNVGVTYGSSSRAQLQLLPHDCLIDDIRDFPQIMHHRRATLGLCQSLILG